MFDYKRLHWWYWLATDVLLIALLIGGRTEAYDGLIALTVVQIGHYLMRERNLAAFPIQVRVTYLGLLLIGALPHMVFIHWFQLAGTSAMVIFAYCPLARIMSLMPWNKSRPYSVTLLRDTILAPPIFGSIQQKA